MHEENIIKKDQKQKLTLGINKEVLEQARIIGINISSITEQVLKAITFDAKKGTSEDLIHAYDVLFEAIKPILKKYNTDVEVGLAFEDDNPYDGLQYDLLLNKNDLRVLSGEMGLYQKITIGNNFDSFHGPIKILENLLRSLTGAVQKNKEKIKEFEIALRIINVISTDEEILKKPKKKKSITRKKRN